VNCRSSSSTGGRSGSARRPQRAAGGGARLRRHAAARVVPTIPVRARHVRLGVAGLTLSRPRRSRPKYSLKAGRAPGHVAGAGAAGADCVGPETRRSPLRSSGADPAAGKSPLPSGRGSNDDGSQAGRRLATSSQRRFRRAPRPRSIAAYALPQAGCAGLPDEARLDAHADSSRRRAPLPRAGRRQGLGQDALVEHLLRARRCRC